jgi:hypothetical protein
MTLEDPTELDLMGQTPHTPHITVVQDGKEIAGVAERVKEMAKETTGIIRPPQQEE